MRVARAVAVVALMAGTLLGWGARARPHCFSHEARADATAGHAHHAGPAAAAWTSRAAHECEHCPPAECAHAAPCAAAGGAAVGIAVAPPVPPAPHAVAMPARPGPHPLALPEPPTPPPQPISRA